MALEILDYKRRFQRGIGSSPFSSFGLEWCPRCETEVDCDTEAHHEGTTYVYRRRCLRCGRVLKAGVFDNVPLLGQPLPGVAVEWITEPGMDRRGRARR
jgi:hypothetical protein